MPSEEGGKEKKSGAKKSAALAAGIVSFASIALGVFYFFYLLGPVSPDAARDMVVFEVKPGDGYRTIVDNLAVKRAIRSKTAFKLLSLLMGSAASLKPGVYTFDRGMTSGEILKKLIAGSRDEVSVTIVEGWSLYDIDRALSRVGILNQGEFAAVAQKRSLEGKLFPDTYRFFTESNPEEAVEKFLENFKSKALPLFGEASEKKIQDVMTLASIIEKEVPDFEDRKIVSGVLKKRLEAGIPLQVDATICYLKEIASYPGAGKCYPLSPLDFKKESPYNTYLYTGLPSGPIANAGLTAIIAALHPKSSPYWYYLSDPATGKTIFSKDLDEQEQNRVKYLGR